MLELTYTVPGMSCGHCKTAVSSELQEVAGVEAVDVDLDTKLVSVRAQRERDRAHLTGAEVEEERRERRVNLDDAVLRAAIEQAGYAAA